MENSHPRWRVTSFLSKISFWKKNFENLSLFLGEREKENLFQNDIRRVILSEIGGRIGHLRQTWVHTSRLPLSASPRVANSQQQLLSREGSETRNVEADISYTRLASYNLSVRQKYRSLFFLTAVSRIAVFPFMTIGGKIENSIYFLSVIIILRIRRIRIVFRNLFNDIFIIWSKFNTWEMLCKIFLDIKDTFF